MKEIKRTFKKVKQNGRIYNLLALPNTNMFKLEVVNMYGSDVEKTYNKRTGKNVYGISHFTEHLAFKSTMDFTSEELLSLLKNEGSYNASTDKSRINYWFQTTADKIDIGIKIVLNIAMNTLAKVNPDEFEIEKNVVYNEAKRYADDDQTMFWFNSFTALCGNHKEDNIIGIPETIQTFTLEDCIAIKDIFLQNDDVLYNITYDPSMNSGTDIINKIELELERFKPLCITEPILLKDYYSSDIDKNLKNKLVIDNESDQAMTLILLDCISNNITASRGNAYLSTYAEGTSLNDIIREKNGLTYGISFSNTLLNYNEYTYFGCDVSKGTEDKMLELFKESINLSVDNFTDEAYDKLMKTLRLKRAMSLVNQNNYSFWLTMGTYYTYISEAVKDVLAEDLDLGYKKIDELYSSKEDIKKYLEKIRDLVNSDSYGKVTNGTNGTNK